MIPIRQLVERQLLYIYIRSDCDVSTIVLCVEMLAHPQSILSCTMVFINQTTRSISASPCPRTLRRDDDR